MGAAGDFRKGGVVFRAPLIFAFVADPDGAGASLPTWKIQRTYDVHISLKESLSKGVHKDRQKGFTTARMTIKIIKTVGTSLMIR